MGTFLIPVLLCEVDGEKFFGSTMLQETFSENLHSFVKGWAVFLVALLVCLPLACFIRKVIVLRRPIPGIPYNVEAASRLMGDVPEVAAAVDPHAWFLSHALKHKSVVTQAFIEPFGRPLVIVADPWEAIDVSNRRTKEFDRSLGIATHFRPIMPENQITYQSHHPNFKRNKQLVKDLMTPAFLQAVSAPVVYGKYMELFELLSRKARAAKGRPFNANDDMHDAALDIIISISFGLEDDKSQLLKQLNGLQPKKGSAKNTNGTVDDEFEFEHVPLQDELAAFAVLADSVHRSLTSPVPELHNFLYKRFSKTMRSSLAIVNRVRDREVFKSLERKRTGETPKCAMDQLLAREDGLAEAEGRKPNYYSESIKSELIGYLLAGHETTSTELRFGAKYLTDFQPVQLALRQALYKAYPVAKEEGRLPTLQEILKTPVQYLEAFIEETVRFTSTTPSVFRETLVDSEILGKLIPKGTTVVFLTNGPGVVLPKMTADESKRTKAGAAYRQKYRAFDDSNTTEFRPERWLVSRSDDQGEELVFDPNAGPPLGFGHGPRMCFGKRLAMLKMRIYFTLFVWTFELLPIGALLNYDNDMSLARLPRDCVLRLRKIGPKPKYRLEMKSLSIPSDEQYAYYDNTSETSFIAAVDSLEAYVEAEGRFDGVIAFS
ncbi:Cytochrome P450 monooxygenase TRI13 [Paramyrothecium foliicola]|nr:Cytochrome P450 monooxygenase TRI13 [Paramyrothecium foliicola]